MGQTRPLEEVFPAAVEVRFEEPIGVRVHDEELVAAVQKVSSGSKYISAALAEKLVVDLERGTDGPPHETLSDREYEVLRWIASGKTVSEIAGILSLSDKTISTYRARILEKMGMKTNAELTHYAIQNKLVE